VTEITNSSGIVSNSGEGEEQVEATKANVPGKSARLKLFVIYGSESRMSLLLSVYLNSHAYN